MDTTSHSFTWQSYSFGGQNGSSYFNDVAIIDENDIWAVGEIHTKDTDQFDSLGHWVQPYNAAHWDGLKWTLRKIPSIICGNNSPIQSAILTVFAFSSNDVWFSDGAELIHFNGSIFKQDCSINPLLVGKINKIWGASDNDLYVVGNSGMIAHYNGQRWEKIESGTDLDIQDIFGAKNEKTNEYEILCVGSKHLQDPQYRRVIYQIQGNSLKELSSSPIEWTLYSVWFVPGIKYYVAGSGIYKKNCLDDKEWQNNPFSVTPYYIYRIRGQQLNDVAAAGGFGEVLHFNGQSWKSYILEAGLTHGNYYSINIKEDLIAVAGIEYPKAVVKLGRR